MTAMLTGTGVGFLASAFGWQINLLALHRGLQESRRACFLTGMGAIVGDLIFISCAYWSGGLMVQHPVIWESFKWMGVVFLIASAYRVWIKNPDQQTTLLEKRKKAHRHFIFGLIVVLVNPFILLIWVGVMSYLLAYTPLTHEAYWPASFGGGFIGGSVLWFFFLTRVVLIRMRGWTVSSLIGFQRISAAALVIAAFVMIFEKF